MGACLRGKVSAWRGDHPAAVRHLERAARCADQLDWADPGVRGRLDILLAEAYVAVGRPAMPAGSPPGCGSSAGGWPVPR